MQNKPYELKFLSVFDYLKYQIKIFGIKHMVGLTESGYPRFLRFGYCDHIRREIVVCKQLVNKNLVFHEIGHEVGLNHSNDRKNVMYANFRRGSDGIDEIIELYSRKYSTKTYIENVEKRIGHEC